LAHLSWLFTGIISLAYDLLLLQSRSI
jgi:hypothetical protein